MHLKIKKRFFNEAYLPFLDRPERFVVLYGGAGSGKSVFCVQKLILKLLKYPKRTLLVVRKISNTLRDSIFEEFRQQLAKFGILDHCTVREATMTIHLPNKAKILFKGIDDPEKIKSISAIDDIMIEEATELTYDDFTQLNLRMRSKANNQQVHLCFNPVSKSNWCYIHWFREGTPPDSVVLKTTWLDNKFLPQGYIDALNDMKRTNPTYYKIYALGEFATLSKLVFDNWEEQEFDFIEKLKIPGAKALFGLDFGYVNDSTAFNALVINTRTKEIHIFDEHNEKAMLNDKIARMLVEKKYAKEVITADSAEQKSIEEIRRLGIRRIRPARKGKDSINQGLQFLKQFKIYVHPRCKHTIIELENYCWEKDKNTNEYTNKPVDEFNHHIDALRYACEELARGWSIKSLGKGSFGL